MIGLFRCIWLPSSIWYVRVDKVLADNTLGEELLYYYIFIAKCPGLRLDLMTGLAFIRLQNDVSV